MTADEQSFFKLQKEYKDGTPEALGRIYNLMFKISYKTINRISTKNKYVAALSAEERRQKAHDAATYIIEQYCKNPNFIITDSVTGYLYLRVCWELYGKDHQNKRDQMLAFMEPKDIISMERRLRAGRSTKKYIYLVKNIYTGEMESYNSASELYLNPKFKGLRKKRLVESIRSGKKWKCYKFDILEVMG